MDYVNQSRKFILQSRTLFENKQGVRLSYARWLVICSILFFHYLALNFKVGVDTFLLLAGFYAFFNLLIWMVSLSIGKGNSSLLTASLVLDVIITTVISSQSVSTIFFFPYVFALIAVVMVGVWEGIALSLVVVGANIALPLLKLQTAFAAANLPPNLEAVEAALCVILFGLTLYILTNSAAPITRFKNEMLEEAVNRTNTDNLAHIQNRVKAIYRVALTLNKTLDFQKVIQGILGELETVFEVSVGAVLLFDENSNLRVADSLKLSEAQRAATFKVGTGALRDVITGGEPLLISDRTALEQLYTNLPSFKGCPSVVILPLRGGFEIFGLVVIASQKENAYSSQDLEWIVALTSHPVVALQNAKLYQAISSDRNRVIRDLEEVRHTLARNLHDGPAQAVAAFSMQAEFIRRLIKNDPDKAVEEVILLGKTAQQTAREIRTLLFELRPLALESQGLESALEQYASRFPTTPDDPKVQFEVNNFTGRLAPNVETTIFAVMQEAVNNTRKHASAENIWISLNVSEGYVIATAQDDGQGFDTKAVKTNYEQRGSMGMTNMRERAALVNGTVQLESAPARGTVVTLKIPLNEANTFVPVNV